MKRWNGSAATDHRNFTSTIMYHNGNVERLYARPQPSTVSNPTKPKKLRRISRACDFCHRRSIRCKPSGQDQRCQNCVDFDVECTFHRPAKKRGIQKHQHEHQDGNSSSGEHANLLLELTNGHVDNSRPKGLQGDQGKTFDSSIKFPLPAEHGHMVLANLDKIQDLVSVYFEVVYPIFPLFHQQTLLRKVATRKYLSDQALFATIMSMCALASARARDGALFPGRWIPSYFRQPIPEAFFATAREATPQDLSAMRAFDWMRSCALLAIFGIQVGKIEIMHQYLGQYHSLVAMGGLYDENNWPKDVGIVEIEERRRLFWSMYTLEVYSSIVWGGIIRCREAQSRVFYPSEVDDDRFSERDFANLLPESPTHRRGGASPTTVTNNSSWLHGWNFTTELYRVLEHAMDDFHRRRPPNIGPFSPSDLFLREAPSRSAVLAKVMSMHAELPDRFKETRSVVSDMIEDRFSFQAANIAATLQLVRMVLFTAEDATVDQICAIAQDLLDGFSKVPVFFLRAISSPLLHHLAGIGSILGSVIEGTLSESAYLQVRTVLLAMADLLASLEVGITRTVGATQRLRDHISRIDEYMKTQRQQELIYSQAVARAPMTDSIDPSLRHEGRSLQPEQQERSWQTQTPGSYGYLANPTGMGDLNGTGEQFQFQLPPELLEGWPWPFDISQGFGTF